MYGQANALHYQFWLHHNLLTWQWWFLLVLSIIPWWIWFRLVDKRRLLEMTSYTLLIALTCTVLDTMGTNLQFWRYRQHLIWFFKPPLIPADLCAIPVADTLVYRYFPRWKSFVMAMVVSSLITSFIAEPLFVWMKIYEPVTWRYVYSFPIYILKSVVAKLIVQQAIRSQSKHRSRSDS